MKTEFLENLLNLVGIPANFDSLGKLIVPSQNSYDENVYNYKNELFNGSIVDNMNISQKSV